MNTKEAANFLGVSVPRISQLIKSKKLPAEKVNGRLKIKKTDLKKILVRGPGIRDYSVRLVFKKFTRGKKGSPPFIEVRHGESGHGKPIMKIELKNIRKETIEKTKQDIIHLLEKDGYTKIFCDF